MKLNMAKYVAVGTACAVLGGGGIATAATTGLLDGHNIKTGSIPTNRLNPQLSAPSTARCTTTWGRRVPRVPRVTLAPRVLPAPLVRRDLLVRRVPTVRPGLPDLRVPRVIPVLLALRV